MLPLLACSLANALVHAPTFKLRRLAPSKAVGAEEAAFVRRCGYYAWAAYDERRLDASGAVATTTRAGAQPWGPAHDAHGFVDDAATGTHAAVWAADATIFVAFRGTDPRSYEDLRTDFDARQTRLGDGALVHAGFYRAWRAVRGDVRRAIDAAAGGREATVCYTGHSLGGALATLAASESGGRLVTFGCPRVGDALFASSFCETCGDAVRVVTAGDVVPRLPRGTLANRILDFRHCCRTLVLRKRASWRLEATRPEVVGADPAAEQDPGYRGVFPVDVRDWRPLPVALRFVLAEASLLAAVLTGAALDAHREATYYAAVAAALGATPGDDVMTAT